MDALEYTKRDCYRTISAWTWDLGVSGLIQGFLVARWNGEKNHPDLQKDIEHSWKMVQYPVWNLKMRMS